MEEKIYCSHCETIIDTGDYEKFSNKILCYDCIDNYTPVRDCCNERIWSEDTYSDEYITLYN
ncbi:MAG: hypothetical protein NC485_02535 [Ruminococcus flavefaciens]|nr:hypothetical protein [Ruminococcus flavefaciens]MCM1060025.1 hypothetical protein [Eubacterium sp.]